MANYEKQTWIDGDSSSKLNATRMNHIEDGISNVSTNKIDTSSIVNNLTTASAGIGALDAYQGKVLNDKIILDEKKIRQSVYGCSLGSTIPTGSTRYVGHYLATEAWSSAFVMASSGTIKNLRVYTGTAPGTDNVYYFDLFVDNIQKEITCSITGTSTNFASDLTHTVSVEAGQRVSLRCAWSTNAESSGIQYSFEFIPD